jgi:isoprenylcysteine carboxyl methyltransferase (ICMT) family protein YpbQ
MVERMNIRLVPIAYGLANAVLYSAILPVWEGFDEPFHFGYVQQIANTQGFPDPRFSTLSREIGSSLLLAPASVVVHWNLPYVTTWREYFSSSHADRTAVQARMRGLPSESRWQSSGIPNYEAQQAPLAYLVLALPERLLAGVSLPVRLLVLRIICAFAGALALYFGAESLFSEIGLRGPYCSAALFCIFSSQMVWATIAHVANDWLAVPLTVWCLAMAMRYLRRPSPGAVMGVASLLAVGLLTKAYFLALLPLGLIPSLLLKRWRDLCIAIAIVLLAAGPWYARNLLRYGTITGMQEGRAGIGATALSHAARGLDWPQVIVSNARAALWTGNNSFLSFSGKTLTAIIVVWLIALVLWAAGRSTRAEWIAVGGTALLAAALAYMTVVSSVYTRGAATGPEPWHSQVLLAPMLGLGLLGCSRSRKLGRPVAIALVMLFGYVQIATYAAKLIPLYGGYEGRTSLAFLIELYSRHLAALTQNLDLISLAPAWIVFSLTATIAALAITQMLVLARSILLWVPGVDTRR